MLKRGDQVGPYYILAQLHSEAMGVFFLVEHGLSTMRHNLVVLPTSFNEIPPVVNAQLGMRHPNLVSIVGILDVGGKVGLLMDTFAGISISHSAGKLSTTSAVEILRDVLSVVGVMHDAGVMHQAIDFSTVLVGKSQYGAVVARMHSFGVANLFSRSATQEDVNRRTSSGMAPETLLSSTVVDNRTDIYSIGVLAYELLTGIPAFSGGRLAMVKRKARGEVVPLASLVDGVPPEIIAAIERAMSPNISDRFVSAREFGEALVGPSFSMPPQLRSLPDVVVVLSDHEGLEFGEAPDDSKDGGMEAVRNLPSSDNPIPAWTLVVALLGVIMVGFLAFGVQAVSGLGSALSQVEVQHMEVLKLIENDKETVEVLRGVGYPMESIDRARQGLDGENSDDVVFAAWRVHDLLNRSVAIAAVGKTPEEVDRIRRMERILVQQKWAFERWAKAVVVWDRSVKIQGSELVIKMGISQKPNDQIVTLAHEILAP
jgi:hypothetical protein